MRIRACCAMLFAALPCGAAAGEVDTTPPLVRDVHAGYLLHCTFRAIRPYIWRQDPLLTGWEADKRGGTWESRPSGFFPEGFAFNVESFRLRDASDRQAVTIRHQIARQTEGKVTLEYLFMLPAPMEGAAWQLRDLERPAVSLVTRGGTLCCETAGQPAPLGPVEPNRQYGVKVVADLAAKTAEIYVDGQLRARRAAFLHPVAALDYVLVKTGDAATGDLFLPLVSVSKGYSVCETFVTCRPGRAPDDWQVAGPSQGGATVEPFPCAAKPDIFSLKLTDGAQAKKAFEPLGAKTVWEFKFLLPQKIDGAAADLVGTHGTLGRIVTAGGDLCYVDPHRKPVPVARDYRANLWYAVRVVADPETGKAEILVNGKCVSPAADLSPPAKAFAAVQFAAPGKATMWIDDVRVCRWRDYPPDYVPEPKPVARNGRRLLGVQSCSLWKEGDAYAGWEYVYPFAQRRKPYLGWYDEGNPEVADWEIKWQAEHGIDFEMYCWYRPNDAIGHPIKEGVLEQGIRQGLFHARYSRLKKFAIMYTNQGAGDTNMDDWRRHIVPYWIEYFFKDPRYWKIDGKPVLSIYYRENFLRDFGGVEGCKKATDLLRGECARAGFPGVVLLMELRSAAPDAMRQMKAMGIDYCYAYTWGTGDVRRQRQNNIAQRDAAAATGFRMLPSISVGWQTAPWDGGKDPGTGWAPVPEYAALARWAKDEFMPSLPAGSLGGRVLMLANWNEFGEGHFIMPSNLAGFGYLDALREVFTAGGPHEDAAPGPEQRRRFTALYPKE